MEQTKNSVEQNTIADVLSDVEQQLYTLTEFLSRNNEIIECAITRAGQATRNLYKEPLQTCKELKALMETCDVDTKSDILSLHNSLDR